MATLSYYCATYPMNDPKHGVGCNGCTCGCHMSGEEHDKKEREIPPGKPRRGATVLKPARPQPPRPRRDRFGPK